MSVAISFIDGGKLRTKRNRTCNMNFVTRLTRLVPLVEQELPSLPEHMSSLPVFSWVRVSRSLVFYVMFCRSLLVPFPFAIVLYVLLQFTASDYIVVSSSFSYIKVFFNIQNMAALYQYYGTRSSTIWDSLHLVLVNQFVMLPIGS
jgi:hypothetical protein